MLLLERWTGSKMLSSSSGSGNSGNNSSNNSRTLLKLLGNKKPEELYQSLAGLAYEVQASYGDKAGAAEIDVGIILKHLYLKRYKNQNELIGYLSENAGVLVSPGQKQEKTIFQFAHRTFQEYLAAEHLVELCSQGDERNYDLVREHITSSPQMWRVACSLVRDVLVDSGRKQELWELVSALLPEEEEIPSRGEAREWWGAWLAATIWDEQEIMKARQKLSRQEKPVREALLAWLVAMLETGQALPPIERAYCGRVLATLGDTRKGVGLYTKKFKVRGRELELPEFEWREIPAPPNGEFMMGASNLLGNLHRMVKLEYNFKMSKYLVTYRQYQSFIQSGEYTNPLWWQGFPKEDQLQEPHKQRYQYQNHPCENVSWYQTVAFCRWLNMSYKAVELTHELGLETGLEIRLPTEKEWEYAARGNDERVYAYGNKYDPTKGNTIDTNIGETTVVGSYPDGSSPFGLLDISGNVWEWCANRESMNNEYRVLRGGSFNGDFNNSVFVYRTVSLGFRSSSIGFRLVVAAHTLLTL
jgi:hypothetical protein